MLKKLLLASLLASTAIFALPFESPMKTHCSGDKADSEDEQESSSSEAE